MPPTDAPIQAQPDDAEGHAIARAIVSLLREMRAEGARKTAEAQAASAITSPRPEETAEVAA